MAEDEHGQPLKRRVEKLIGAGLASVDDLTADQMREVIHELRMQNEELNRAKVQIARLTTLYAVLSRVNEAIVRIRDEEALYQEVCRIVAEEGGFPLVWVGRVKERQVMPVASSGPAAAYVKEIRVEVEGELGRGPTGTCIREERPVVNDDFATNPSTAPWREPALRYGFRASAAFPLRRQGRVISALTLYAAAPDAFDRDQVKLLDSLCADISYALDAMHQEELRRKAEEALRQSEEQFRAMFELAAVGMVQADPRTGRLLRVNEKYCAITGYSGGELIGRAFPDITHPEDRERDWEAFQRAARGETPDYRSEKRYVRKDGTVVWVNVNAAMFRDAIGEPVRTVAAIEDITDRKRAEDALHENQARLEAVFAAMPYGIVEYDTNLRPVRANVAAMKAAGVTSLDFTRDQAAAKLKFTKLDGSLVRTEDLPTSRALRGEIVADEEYSITNPYGMERVISAYAVPLYKSGKIEGVVALWDDITKRKQAEQGLQHSVRRFELLAATASELLQAPEPQKVLEPLCRKVMKHLDCDACFNFLADEKAGRLRLNACAGIPSEEAQRIEWLDYGVTVCGCVARDGCRIVAEHIPTTPDVRTELVKSYGIKAYACHPLVGAGGRVIGTLSFGTRSRETFSTDDLSLMEAVSDQVAVAMIRMQSEQVRRRSEDALRRANEQLEERVRERTAELVALTENLTESRDQLRSLASDLTLMEARERRALAADLHDTVAQTLAIAKLRLEAAGARLEGKSAEEVKRVVEFIRQAIRQSRSLMADLSPSLLYEAGLGQALRVLARRMGELHSLPIAVVDDGNPKPLGENYRVLVFRAVQELLHNAVKHAKATEVKVSLHWDHNLLRIEVEDDGVGFTSSHVGRVDGKEAAFGLFSIRERVQHLGGSFEVVSRPGRGVRVILIVPLQEEKGEEAGPAVIRILIAEDHRMMRDALASLLEKEPGFEVVGLAEDGLEAVRLAHEAEPDVVLMDANMPDMDGIEATRQITAELPEIKVIGLSVQSEPPVASEMLAAGAISFVAKSSSPQELTQAIRTAVGSTRGT